MSNEEHIELMVLQLTIDRTEDEHARYAAIKRKYNLLEEIACKHSEKAIELKNARIEKLKLASKDLSNQEAFREYFEATTKACEFNNSIVNQLIEKRK